METHLWYILPNEIKSQSLLKHYTEILSPSEKDHLLRMRCDELKKKNVLLARTSVRTTIARYQTNNNNTTVVDPKSLKFKKNLYGKPEVVDLDNDDTNHPKLQFNISHTDSLIACGVTVNVPIGI
ncbi:unnamed protein product [Arabis nemorensis]|uniref:holo-[acyl-carrier-protein] synthase n=1 Tax=Arabis nemorensis TaxID=586526 RepID=A0A565B7T9_9BRAS|nr:unnamed protein product [Arabis nemorensis]